MKKKVILHIGCEKTGTTSVQETLALNRNLLLEKFDTLYPISMGNNGNHTKLAIYACNEDKNLTRFLPKGKTLGEFRKLVRDSLLDEVQTSPASQVVLSCEWLHPRLRDEDEFERLRKLLDEVSDNIEIVIYIRRQDQLAMSLYSTSLRAGNYESFSFPQINATDQLPYYFDFLSIYKNWKKVFGADNIFIRAFDREKLHKSDVVSDFLQTLEMDSSEFKFYRESNRSLNKAGILLMRGVNRLFHFMPKFISHRYVRLTRYAVAKKFEGKSSLATDVECSEFLNWFQSSNRELETEYEADTGKSIKLF